MTALMERARRLPAADRMRFTRIFEESFPAEEREPASNLLDGIERGERECHLLRVGGEIAGLAVLLRLRSGEADVLEYLAVDAARRSGGLGGRLLDHVRGELGRPSATSLGILLEVEDPEAAEAPERELRRRRIAFYERNGAEVVACAPEYRAPNLAAPGTVRYRLMWLPHEGRSAELSGGLLRRCAHDLLTESYGLDARSELVQEVLSSLTC